MKKIYTFSISKEIKEKFSKICKEKFISQSAIIEDFLKKFIKENETKNS